VPLRPLLVDPEQGSSRGQPNASLDKCKPHFRRELRRRLRCGQRSAGQKSRDLGSPTLPMAQAGKRAMARAIGGRQKITRASSSTLAVMWHLTQTASA